MRGLLRNAARSAMSSGLATPEKWVVEWFKGGDATTSGVSVSPDTALTYGPFFAGIRVLAEDVGSLPLHVYERLEPRGKRRATDHPLYPLLHSTPNPLMTAVQLRETVQAHVPTWGNGYVEIVRDSRGRVVELWPLRPDRMQVEVIRRGPGRVNVRYQYRDEVNGISATLHPDQVLHIAGLGFDGVRGYSIVSMARNAIGLGLATEAYGGAFFRNGSRPSGVLQHPKAVSDEARRRMKEDWEAIHQGLDRAQRIAILEEGVTWEQMGIPPEEAQFLETRKMQVEELSRWLRIPPHKLGHLERATYSNIEHQGIDYVTSALRPWLVRWEQALALRAFNSDERARYFAEHLVDGLLRGDTKSRYESYAVARQWGWMSADDVNELENRNPLPDGQGETYLVPLNMVDAASLTAASDDLHDIRARIGLRSVEGRRRLEDSFRPLIIDLDARMAKLERAEVSSLVRRHLDEGRGRSTDTFMRAVEDLYRGTVRQRAIDRWQPLMTTYAAEIAAMEASDLGIDTPDLERWVEAYVAGHVDYRVGSSLGQLQAIVDEGGEDLTDAITARLDHWVETRPGRTGAWEALAMAGAAARETWRSGGIERMRWQTRGGEDCPGCSSLDGVIVAIDQPFADAGTSQGQIPVLRKTFHPPLHPGCDCEIVSA